MLNTITTTTFDLDGYAEIDATTDQGTQARRVNRVATLDGSSVFNDFGYSESDRTITATWTPDDAEREATVARMVRLYSRLLFSCRDGVFLVAPESYKSTGAISTLTLLVVSKQST